MSSPGPWKHILDTEIIEDAKGRMVADVIGDDGPLLAESWALWKAAEEAARSFALLSAIFDPKVFPIYIEAGSRMLINGKDYGEIADMCRTMKNALSAICARIGGEVKP